MEILRERKRAIYKALIREYGKSDAYDMYGEFINYPKPRCSICGSFIRDYSEWSDTGYEIRECLNGCFSHTVYSMTHVLETKGFSYRGVWTEKVEDDFEAQINKNSKSTKENMKLYWKKKKSQKRRANE